MFLSGTGFPGLMRLPGGPGSQPKQATPLPAIRFGVNEDRLERAQPDPDRVWMGKVLADLKQWPEGDRVRVGRDNTRVNHVLEEGHVSRVHAEFFQKNGRFYVRDLGTPVGDLQTPGSALGTWYVDGSSLIPYPIDIRGNLLREPSGEPQKKTFLTPGKPITVALRSDPQPKEIRNGDWIFIKGHLFPVEGLPETGLSETSPIARNTAETDIATQTRHGMIDYIRQLEGYIDNFKGLDQWSEESQTPELIQLRMILNRNVRFSIYLKLRDAGLSKLEADFYVEQIREKARQAMMYLAPKVNQMKPIHLQSMVDIRRLMSDEARDQDRFSL